MNSKTSDSAIYWQRVSGIRCIGIKTRIRPNDPLSLGEMRTYFNRALCKLYRVPFGQANKSHGAKVTNPRLRKYLCLIQNRGALRIARGGRHFLN